MLVCDILDTSTTFELNLLIRSTSVNINASIIIYAGHCALLCGRLASDTTRTHYNSIGTDYCKLLHARRKIIVN